MAMSGWQNRIVQKLNNHPASKRYTHMVKHKQLTLAEVFEDCQNKYGRWIYAKLELDGTMQMWEDTKIYMTKKQNFT